MQFSAVFAAAMLAVSVSAQLKENPKPAAAILNNPVGKHYEAEFNHPKVVGTVKFTAGKNGEGVDIVVSLAGFEGEPGPFGYHIHDQPVPLDGNCTLTKAHLDPYGRGQLTPCVKSKPETCEVGDLAGKHGKIPGSESGPLDFGASYNDLYASTKEGIGAFLGNRSIVIHRNDTTRLACANIVLVDDGEYPTETKNHESTTATGISPSGTNYPSQIGSNSTTPSKVPFPSQSANAAVVYGLNSVVAVGGLVAGLLAVL